MILPAIAPRIFEFPVSSILYEDDECIIFGNGDMLVTVGTLDDETP